MLRKLSEKVEGKSGTREGNSSAKDGNQPGREGGNTSRTATATARSGDGETERTKEATTLEGRVGFCTVG